MPPRPRAIPNTTRHPDILRASCRENSAKTPAKTLKTAAFDARIAKRLGKAGGRRGSAPGRSGLTLSAHVPADSLDQRPASRMPSPSSALGSPASPQSFAIVPRLNPHCSPLPRGCGHANSRTRSMRRSTSPAATALDRTQTGGDSSTRGTGNETNNIFSQRRAALRDPRTCSTCAASVALARGGRPFQVDPGMARPRSGVASDRKEPLYETGRQSAARSNQQNAHQSFAGRDGRREDRTRSRVHESRCCGDRLDVSRRPTSVGGHHASRRCLHVGCEVDRPQRRRRVLTQRNSVLTGGRGSVCGPRPVLGERGAPSADAPSRRRMRLGF